LSGLKTHQLALDTTSNNISNINTPGYSKQIVNFSTTPPIDRYEHQLGTGVTSVSITRSHDEMIFSKVKIGLEQNSREKAMFEGFKELDDMIAEYETSDNGINKLIDNMFESLQAMTEDPTNKSVEMDFRSNLEMVLKRVGYLNTTLSRSKEAIQEDIDNIMKEAQMILAEFDRLTVEIAQLEAANESSEKKEYANRLRDQRDELERKLASIGYFTVQKTKGSNGEVNVSDLGHEIYSRNFDSNGGELKGKKELKENIDKLQDQFNAKFQAFVKEMNDKYTEFGNEKLIEDNFQVTKKPINLSSNGMPGNVDIGLNMLQLQKFDNGGHELVISISAYRETSERSLMSTENILSIYEEMHDKVSKVNLDEEMVNLVRFKRGYEANAKVIETMDEILKTTLDMKR
jgi:flagellar hook-associated protein 1 FlgK